MFQFVLVLGRFSAKVGPKNMPNGPGLKDAAKLRPTGQGLRCDLRASLQNGREMPQAGIAGFFKSLESVLCAAAVLVRPTCPVSRREQQLSKGEPLLDHHLRGPRPVQRGKPEAMTAIGGLIVEGKPLEQPFQQLSARQPLLGLPHEPWPPRIWP